MKNRIEKNEKYLDESLTFVKELENLSKSLDQIQPSLSKLNEYYGSKDWYNDIEEYDKKKLNIKAGVLSEDAIWNMNVELDELLLEVRNKIDNLINSRKPTIVLASNNKHKIKEFKKMLPNYNILSLSDINYNEEIDETGTTFEENSLLKAKTIHDYLKKDHPDYLVIADDSGLCCEALNGAPGIYSARYAGNHNDQANRDKLRKDLKDKDHTAYFNCTIIVYYPDETHKVFVGKTYGTIIEEEKGDTSFGYDCIFLSKDLNKTFGEATEEEKNSVSHRGRAIIEMIKEL